MSVHKLSFHIFYDIELHKLHIDINILHSRVFI